MKEADKKSELDIRHARTGAQAQQMLDIAAQGICPFCQEHLKATHREPIEREGQWWSVLKNDYPYEGSRVHYLFVFKEHVEDIDHVTPEGFAELLSHMQWVRDTHNLKGGTLLMRFGNTGHTGATIPHLHAHLIVGGDAEGSTEKLRATVGYQMPK